MLNAYNKGKYKEITVKTGKYNTYKVPKYKYKKVTKKKWVYKHVLNGEDFWSDDFIDYTTYDYSTDYYWNHGWTYYGNYYKTYDNGHHVKYFTKFKINMMFFI